MAGPDSRLKVYLRVKPIEQDQRTIIDIVDDETLYFDPIDAENEPTGEYYYRGKKHHSIGARRNKHTRYSFDKVFSQNCTNYHIYETVTKPMVDATINGLNCCVFAYGATGSGKTFTMLGNRMNPGVIYYTSKNLFGKLITISETDPLPADLKICYFEIYNEKVRDLLETPPETYITCGNKRLRTTPERCRARLMVGRDAHNLPVCDGSAAGGTLIIPDLTYHKPLNAEQLIELIDAGNKRRSQHPTDANAESSRSHAIFQIVLTRRVRKCSNNNNYDSPSAEYELQSSKLSLIDLAGSERASAAYRNDRSKNRQTEGGNINKSLLALGNCINALSDAKRGPKHIPYRDSKLTRLLRDSLGGKCRTAMIANVCQQESHFNDTQNTLMYASRAKCIKLRPGRNFTEIAVQPRDYTAVIDKQNKQISGLQSENDNLKAKMMEMEDELRQMHDRAIEPKAPPRTMLRRTFTLESSGPYFEHSKFKSKLDDLYEERRNIRLEILRYESKFRMNELKLAFKRLDDARSKAIHGDLQRPSDNNTTQLFANALSQENIFNPDHGLALKSQLGFFEQERKTLLDKININDAYIRDVISSMTAEYEMEGYGTPEKFEALIEPYIGEKERLLEVEEKKHCEQHAFDIAQTGFNRLIATEGLLVEAAGVVRYTHAITKGRCLSEQLEAKLMQLFKKLEGKKSVVWKDDKYAMENDTDNTPLTQLLSVHDNFSLNFLTPFKNNNSLLSRRLSKNLVSLTNYTPEQSNVTFDVSE